MDDRRVAQRRHPGDERLVDAFALGRAVVLCDPLRERTCLALPADSATVADVAFMIRYTSGFLQVALLDTRCDELQLPEAIPTSRHTPSFARGQCVGVDAAQGIGTGISATDRARTAHVLADPDAVPTDLTRPGHLIPVRASTAGIEHDDIPARAVDAAIAARRSAAALFADLEISDASARSTVAAAEIFARLHGLQHNVLI